MTYTKNYTRKEIKLNFDGSREELPENWKDDDDIKVLDTDEHPVDSTFLLVK
jgi:hypothetical protein